MIGSNKLTVSYIKRNVTKFDFTYGKDFVIWVLYLNGINFWF